MIVDRQGRRFRNLRISLTSACNYACTYCVPNGKRLVAAQDELSAEAMARGVAYLIEAAGIERLRITGGEPLVSPKLEAFMTAVGKMGLEDISLTTNGQLLAKKLPLLVDAGIRRINVPSIPSTPAPFAALPVAAIWRPCSTAWTRPALA
jgi:cyclic pyranopterin phosphate synthase